MTDLFANVNDGDFVRVEFKDGAIEGTVSIGELGRKSEWRGVRNSVTCYSVTHLAAFATKVTVLRAALPPEPPKGSVVLDKESIAWQHAGAGTWFSTEIMSCRIWPNLHADRGPLRVIYTPEEK